MTARAPRFLMPGALKRAPAGRRVDWDMQVCACTFARPHAAR